MTVTVHENKFDINKPLLFIHQENIFHLTLKNPEWKWHIAGTHSSVKRAV